MRNSEDILCALLPAIGGIHPAEQIIGALNCCEVIGRIESTVWINPLLSGPRRKFVFDQWYEISHQKFGFKQTATTGYFDGDFYLSCLSISFFSSSTNLY